MGDWRRLPLCEAMDAICYPAPRSKHCSRVLDELRELGVEYYIDAGSCTAGRLHMIGRGWSANVFLAEMRGRVVVVKALRPDSRRRSVAWEAAAWTIAWWVGAAPEPYKWGVRVLVVEPVLGPPLERCRLWGWRLLYLLSRLLWKAYMLDRVGLLHGELARPRDHVLIRVESDGAPEPLLVDFESSRPRRRGGRSNVTQLLGGLLRLQGILGWLPSGAREKLRRVLRAYREGVLGVDVVSEVVGVVERYMRGLRGPLTGAEEEDCGARPRGRLQFEGDSRTHGSQPGRCKQIYEGRDSANPR